MERGKKPLHVSEKHLKKRLRVDTVGILTAGSGKPTIQSLPPIPGGATNFDVSLLLNLVPPIDTLNSAGATSSTVPLSSEVKDDLEEAYNLQYLISSVNKLDTQCEICLLCLCGTDCPVCTVHSEEVCHHCEKCRDGEMWDSDEDPQSSDDDDDKLSSETDFRTALATWAITHDIREDSLRDLLHLIRTTFKTKLPADPRTLKKTPSSSVKTRLCHPGLYWHAGIVNGLALLNFEDVIKLDFSIDGVPLAKSSKSCFWPILCRDSVNANIFLLGVYHGHEKPSDSNDFLRDFCDELKTLCTEGVHLNGSFYQIEPGLFIGDAPAKAFALKIKAHNAYYGCTTCTEEGEYISGRVVYPKLDLPLRSDADFRSMAQEEHHHEETILLQIPGFNLIDDVVLDYMHLVLLGVVRKLMNLWISGKVPVRLQSRVLVDVSEKLESLTSFMPREYSRKPRPLHTAKFWKATEWRELLFILGPVVLLILKNECEERYNNFLILHVAMTILTSESLFNHYGSDYPNQLLLSFVKGFAKLYGSEQLSHNVHNLVHISQDVSNHHIVLDRFSAFPLENFLQKVKKLVRKGDKPLQQLAKRYAEMRAIQCSIPKAHQNKAVYSRQHSRGPLFRGCVDPKYSFVKLKDFSLDLSTGNRCCGLVNGKIVEISNFAFCLKEQCMVIIGRFYQSKSNLYEYPLPSSHLGIWKVKNLSLLMPWNADLICSKYVRFPFEDGFAVFRMLHIDQSKSQLSG